jgi:hypothetical protein
MCISLQISGSTALKTIAEAFKPDTKKMQKELETLEM